VRYRVALVAAFFVAATALLADFFAVFTTESKPIDPRPSLTRLLDRGLQLRIAPDGKRTLLVRYTVKGSNTERQYRLLVAPGGSDQQLHWWHQRKTLCSFCQPLVESRESGSTRTARHVQRVSEIEALIERVDCHQDRVAILKRDVFDAR
jgi:hypothetical protein